jgi:hypothetical protein
MSTIKYGDREIPWDVWCRAGDRLIEELEKRGRTGLRDSGAFPLNREEAALRDKLMDEAIAEYNRSQE